MAARKQSLLTAFLDWVVRGPEPRAQPRAGKGDTNLFALLCRLTC
jgi:hypothetical protein